MRYTTKYDHSAGCLEMKMTDDAVCLQVSSDLSSSVYVLTCGAIPTCIFLTVANIDRVFQYKSDAAADVKKMEKFVNNLMR